jgi:hypothetical protein
MPILIYPIDDNPSREEYGTSENGVGNVNENQLSALILTRLMQIWILHYVTV